jgi:UDP-N-acetylmuramyl pentapeptide phosphotransferase/UDP-N-acetylglucosamine-1-phosphate transferase
MGYLILSYFIAAFITWISIPVIINIAKEKHLVDVPDDRKVHTDPIPPLGGVGIFAGFIVSALLIWPGLVYDNTKYLNSHIQYIGAASLIIFFLGIKDDIVVISPLKKFIGQLIASWIVVYKCDLQIESFYGVFGVNGLPNALSLGITYFAIVLITNSFNLIDGIDGLSGHLTIISCICFGIFFTSYNLQAYGIVAFAMAGAVSGFLVFNYHPAKIFMGDTGSLLIGLINAVLLIKLMNLTGGLEAGIFVNRFRLVGGPIVALSFIAIPLFDTARVFAIRIIKGRSPFSPDRNHIHHILMDKGFGHIKITTVLSLAAIVIIATAYLGSYLFVPTGALIVTLLASLVLFVIAYFLPNKVIAAVAVESNNIPKESTIANETKLIAINKESSAN